MKDRIIHKLKETEKEYDVEILFAVESGSRAWGFASPDSDFDIRFVYKRNKDWYLNLWEQKDTIQFMTEDDLDGSGWDLRKALLLLAKGNASFLGWLFSPVVYLDNNGVLDGLKKLAQENFKPVSVFHHYHSMNRGFNEVLNKREVNLKHFFYFVRTALCANWVVQKRTVPPVDFKELYELISFQESDLLTELIKVKSSQKESGKWQPPQELLTMCERILSDNEEKMPALSQGKVRTADFNHFFIKEIQ